LISERFKCLVKRKRSSMTSKLFFKLLEELNARDVQRSMISLSQRCFNECVKNMREAELSANETKCLQSCAEKVLSATQRVSVRFMEQNQAMMGNPALLGSPAFPNSPSLPPK